ncbi:ECs_2282 family putative zinc-binding protein [Escherichia coli]|uniref:ECs_2282 family putative zinc-binding protein n=1 Tax=Enterobacteriaceae TaxID=543 RepID=UPI000FA124F5|nr:hypothetical protein [Escherichia coli]MGJ93507.1 hypothetical protein [Escherichia coli]MQL35909.1 hypothetical protein [Escherichia coli]MRE31341.1 hypothetical protein [Escherichia coli]MRE99369.1 hypothetical protein [Escherichia coli]
MNTIKFSCPECGGEVFDTSFKPQGSDSFAGAICKSCGHLVTEDESSQFDDEIVDNIFGALTRDFLK